MRPRHSAYNAASKLIAIFMKPAHLILYTRGYCHLCHDMQALVESYSPQYNFELELREVDTQADWIAQFDELVPVLVTVDNQGIATELCHYHLDVPKFLQFLAPYQRV